MHTAVCICGDLNENGRNRPIGSDFIGGVDILELVGTAFLEKVCHLGSGL